MRFASLWLLVLLALPFIVSACITVTESGPDCDSPDRHTDAELHRGPGSRVFADAGTPLAFTDSDAFAGADTRSPLKPRS